MDNLIKIMVNGKELLEWDDDSNRYYPEDLTWSREIADVFWAGVKAGRQTKQDEEINIVTYYD